MPAMGVQALPLPAKAQGVQVHAVGTYRLPGMWALRHGSEPDVPHDELRFTSFGAAFGWQVDVTYPNLPRRTRSVLLAPGSMPNVPDLFAAGTDIVVYRGSNPVPQRVAAVAGARLLWSAHNAAGEFLAYADEAGAMWLLTRPPRAAWGAPVALAPGRAALTVTEDGTIFAATHEGKKLALRRFDGAGAAGPVVAVAPGACH